MKRNPIHHGWVTLATAGVASVLLVVPATAEEIDAAPRAVAAPNVRIGLHYDFMHLDRTDTFSSAGGPSTLRVPSHDGHAGRAEIVGSLPVAGPVGARVIARGRYGHRQWSLDGLSRGNNEISTYGAGAELFVRDPRVGQIAVGGGYDRLSRDGPTDANEFGGNATVAIYFPDLGLGPVDWTIRFDFVHRQVSGVAGSTDVDSDNYRIVGSAGWYATENVQVVFGGQWERAEEEFWSEDDREGFVQIRWRLPIPVPTEFTVGASAGVSEYKESPFRTDIRGVYGATAGLVFRWGGGATLMESIRRYD